MDSINPPRAPTTRSIPALARIGLLVSPAAIGLLVGLIAAIWQVWPAALERPELIERVLSGATLAVGWGGFRLVQGLRHTRLLLEGERVWGKIGSVKKVIPGRGGAIYETIYVYGDPPRAVSVYDWSSVEPRHDVPAVVVRDRHRPYVAVVPMALRIPLSPGEGGQYHLFRGVGLELARFGGILVVCALSQYVPYVI